MRRRKAIARLGTRAGKLAAVAALLAWSLVPIALIVLSSLKPGQDIFAVPPRWTFAPTLEHYAALWERWGAFFDGLVNSTVVTAGATAIAIVTSTCAGYVYSRNSGRLLQGSVLFLIVVRLIPPIVVTLPLFPIVNLLRLNDTHVVLMVLYATFFVSLGTVLMRTFIDQIPRELDEAARIDGAGRLTILRRVIVPLAAPGILAVAVFVVVFAWNEFPLRFHLHLDARQDRAARHLGDDRFDRRGRLGHPLRGVHGAARAHPPLRRLHEPLPRRRPDVRRGPRDNQTSKGGIHAIHVHIDPDTSAPCWAPRWPAPAALGARPASAADKTLNVLSHKVHQTVLGGGGRQPPGGLAGVERRRHLLDDARLQPAPGPPLPRGQPRPRPSTASAS